MGFVRRVELFGFCKVRKPFSTKPKDSRCGTNPQVATVLFPQAEHSTEAEAILLGEVAGLFAIPSVDATAGTGGAKPHVSMTVFEDRKKPSPSRLHSPCRWGIESAWFTLDRAGIGLFQVLFVFHLLKLNNRKSTWLPSKGLTLRTQSWVPLLPQRNDDPLSISREIGLQISTSKCGISSEAHGDQIISHHAHETQAHGGIRSNLFL